MSDVSDSRLIELSLTEVSHFDEIFLRHREAIFRFVARRVGWESAADLTGEVFVRAFEGRSRYELRRPSARSWLLGIASHVCVDHLRRTGLRRRRRDEVAAGWLYRLPVESDRVVDDADARRLAPMLVEALRKLSESDRQVLLLQAVTELSYREIADILDIPIGTVRSKLNRARRRMRELIGDEVRTLLWTEDGR
ncbi:MAG: RNA polymerase sigma factor [Acidimicrobiia bacterium]